MKSLEEERKQFLKSLQRQVGAKSPAEAIKVLQKLAGIQPVERK
jgi:hypothetical protein